MRSDISKVVAIYLSTTVFLDICRICMFIHRGWELDGRLVPLIHTSWRYHS